ncbi:hypothetical protein [Deinococcus sp. QL22]|uniref:hypothetical protein n=1 Tax=Deinococcus sp. QL22 TaxID=2939437 RepID=UPI0020175CC2|nr:hypothetical protein [Deinococcus sp. QL22]UQN07623.1 hypothetical protein M1R55_06995 [Deinococcus sp. QL22]
MQPSPVRPSPAQHVIRWMLGGLVVFSLAACSPAGGNDDDEDSGTVTEQSQENDSEGEDD